MINVSVKSFLLILYLLLCGLSQAQEFKSFDREKWQEIKKGINYTGDETVQEEEQEKEEDNDQWSQSSGPDFGGSLFSFAGPVFKILIIAVFIVLLVFVISKLIGNNVWLKKNRKTTGRQVPIEELEENLLESDLMLWLKKAADEKNYRLALRIYYLMIIKELSVKGLIRWQKEKTNHEYLYEMRGHSSHQQFEELTGIYQLIWYGEKDLGDPYLIKASHKFKDYFHSINTLNNG